MGSQYVSLHKNGAMKGRIIVQKGDIGRLSKATGYSRITVGLALQGKIATPAARKIRYTAVKHFGGVVFVPAEGGEV